MPLVALDASFLSRPPSGTGTYVANLLMHLPTVAPDLGVISIEPQEEVSGRLGRARWELLEVGREAARLAPDLLHVPTFSAPLWSPCPLVVTIHDVIPLVLPEYRRSRAMRAHLAIVSRTARAAQAVIVPSHHAAGDVVAQLALDPKRVWVTPEAADASFRPAEDREAAREAVRELGIRGRYIFNIGGLDVRKNLPLLLEAFASIRHGLGEDVQLVIAGAAHTGNATVYPPLEPVIERLVLRDAVVLPGRVTEAQRLALYQAADLYVTPSLYEGFGLTAVEAMACGVPLIGVKRTSLPEVVGDGGILVEPEIGALATAMRSVLTSNDVERELREKALRRAMAFSWEETARLTAEVYRSVLSERKG